MRLATSLFVLGLILVPTAVGGLAGPWWAVLVAGIECIALAVLTDAATRPDKSAEAPEVAR